MKMDKKSLVAKGNCGRSIWDSCFFNTRIGRSYNRNIREWEIRGNHIWLPRWGTLYVYMYIYLSVLHRA